jgi:hypothetical protein
MKQATWVSERYKITPPAKKPEAEKKETQEKQEVSHG